MLDYITILSLIDWNKLDSIEKTEEENVEYTKFRVLSSHLLDNGDETISDRDYMSLMSGNKLLVNLIKKQK